MNIYDEIRSKLTNKQVARYYLGEPQQHSGNSIGYCSPFRNEKHPSFWVNDEKGFTDFAAKEHSGNMVTFVMQYKNLPTYFDAAKQLINDFGLNIEIKENMSCFSKNRIKEKITDLVFDKGNKPKDINCMFDIIEHTSKPDKKEAAYIKNRIPNLEIKKYSLDEILNNIVKGKTIIPSGIKSNAKQNFKGQQLFLVDFDNTKNGIKICANEEEHATINKILEYCKKIEFMPTFAYYTFSHSEEQHKFRVGYVLEEPIVDYKTAEKIPKKLLEIFKDFNPDTSKQNLADFFYGGKSIAYKSDNYYCPRLLEGYAYNDEFEISEDKYKQYNDLLRPHSYEFSNRGLVKKIVKKDVLEDKVISNFIAIPTKFITYNDGNETRTDVTLKTILNTGEELPKITLNIKDFESLNWIANGTWNFEPRISPNGNNKEYFKDTSKILSKLSTKEIIYSHMGFRKINGKLHYLYHGGVIGENKDIKVDLSESGLEQYKFIEDQLDSKQIKECVETSLSLLNVGKETIIVPLLGTIFLAPLQEIFREIGIANGFVTWILGESGTQKSTLAALILSHFGNFERDTIPCGFKDTVNSLEKQAFIVKDSVLLIDDYYPSQSLQESRKMEAVAESIFGMAGDKQGRSRMKQNGKDIRKSYSSRGILMATGENFPNFAESRVARSVIVEIEKGDLRLDILSYLQGNKDKLNICMREYIKWIIVNYDKIREQIKIDFPRYREKFNRDFSHARIPENMASLYIGCEMFFEFARANGVIDTTIMTEWKLICFNSLLKLANKQSIRTSDSKPDKMFFYAIQELLASGEAYFQVYLHENQSSTNPYAKVLGCYDSQKSMYYLIPGTAYKLVVEYYEKQNIKFPLNPGALWTYLKKHGSIAIAEKDRNMIRRKINNESIAVIAVHQQMISPDLGKNSTNKENEEIILPF